MLHALRSIHEGEAFLVLLSKISIELLLQIQIDLLSIVVFQSGLDEDTGSNDRSDGPAEGVDLQEMGSAVETVEFLWRKLFDECGQLLSDDVLDDVGLDLGRFLEFVIESE